MAELALLTRGKVRDIYYVDDDHLLLVATDRLSAFDVVFSDKIPGKGTILTDVSRFWFDKTAHIVQNHCMNLNSISTPELRYEITKFYREGNAMLVRAIYPFPIEAIVRGYLVGSAWAEYENSGSVCGIELPKGLKFGEKLEQPLFTPTTKAKNGSHDVNLTYDESVSLLGNVYYPEIKEVSIRLYNEACEFALKKGIIIADTKFEFGLDSRANLVLMDELLTPDSSRYWKVEDYRVDQIIPSMDKQIVRDYLESIGWNKKPPAPKLPSEIIEKMAEKYKEIRNILLS